MQMSSLRLPGPHIPPPIDASQKSNPQHAVGHGSLRRIVLGSG